MMKRIRVLPVVAATAAALSLGAATLPGWADEEIPFEEAHLFFELNDTDGDLGIHGKVDGGPWKYIRIEDPNERMMMAVRTRGRLRRQGLTEIFFESAEPPFDELAPATFFNRFPEGTYEIEGMSLDREELESEVEITHVMPAPPVPTVNEVALAVQCDEDEPGYDAPEVIAPITIRWESVTMSHDEIGISGVNLTDKIINYEVVVEHEDDEFTSVLSVMLPPDQLSMTIPEEFTALGDTFKYEVLAREESDNQTAVESCFKLAE